jgi:CRP/FNR family transcriptional regulator
METKDLVNKVLENTGLELELAEEILSIGRLKKAVQGQVIITPEMPGDEMPIVLQGLLKVMRQDADGNEIFLYYLEGGQTCAMSITCCIEGKRSAFRVIAEDDSILWMVPMGYLDRWIVKYHSFRKFVFQSYQMRFDEMLATIDSVVFTKMDERIFKYLLDKKQASGSFVIEKTHEQIARDLNTSRVVVSRLLKQMEKQDKIEQHRNRIEIL